METKIDWNQIKGTTRERKHVWGEGRGQVSRLSPKMLYFVERYHLCVHLLLGVLVGRIVNVFLQISFFKSLIFALVGSVFLDVDHFFFIWGYGKKSAYSKKSKKVLAEQGIKSVCKFWAENHKYHPGLVSHSLFFVVLNVLLSIGFWFTGNVYWLSFSLAGLSHLVFDACEDILFFGKLNSSWFLKTSA